MQLIDFFLCRLCGANVGLATTRTTTTTRTTALTSERTNGTGVARVRWSCLVLCCGFCCCCCCGCCWPHHRPMANNKQQYMYSKVFTGVFGDHDVTTEVVTSYAAFVIRQRTARTADTHTPAKHTRCASERCDCAHATPHTHTHTHTHTRYTARGCGCGRFSFFFKKNNDKEQTVNKNQTRSRAFN